MRLRRPLALTVALVAALAIVGPTASVAEGDTYYVSTTGADTNLGTCGGGGESSPWRTIEFGMRCLHPGDTLVVRGGTYHEEVTPVTRSGTASEPILVTNAPGERVVVAGIVWLRSDGNITGFDHWTVRGINVTFGDGISGNFQWLVKFVGGRNWVYEAAEVWNAGPPNNFAAVRVEDLDDGPAGEPSNWTLRRLCVHDTRAAHSTPIDHNIYIDTGLDAGPGLIERTIAFNANNGENLKLGPEAANVTVRYNTLYNASQNVVVDVASRNLHLERNLIGRVTGKEWYPHIRGFNHSGPNVVARENLGFEPQAGSTGFIFNTESATGVADGGHNRWPVPTSFDALSCGGFRPQQAHAMGYGRYSRLDRIEGPNRVATSVQLSRAAFGNPAAVDAVLIARSDQYPDALAGAPLAAKVGGPVLLTNKDTLSPETRAEVQRLGPKTAYLLGSQNAVSAGIESELKSMGVGTVRFAGSDRFDTAVKVGAEVGGSEVYVVEGADADPRRGWPDAVSVAGLAAEQGKPILLVRTERVPELTRQALIDLGVTQATIVGGEGAVSSAVAGVVADPDGDGTEDVTVDRIAGGDRYETSALVAQAAIAAGASPSTFWLASGGNWPDALASGPIVAQAGGVFVLVNPADLNRSAGARNLLSAHAGSVGRALLVGGAAALSFTVADQVAGTLG